MSKEQRIQTAGYYCLALIIGASAGFLIAAKTVTYWLPEVAEALK